MSVEEHTRFARRGFLRHFRVFERAVAVRRRSGWRIREFDLELMSMFGVTGSAERNKCAQNVHSVTLQRGQKVFAHLQKSI
jgi:hypothetical protein